MHANAFVCLKQEIKHTVSRTELPMEFCDLKPWEKHGYALLVELPNGDLCKVTDVHDGAVEFVNEETGATGSIALRDVQ